MQQFDDFSPGKPGSANVRTVLDYHGLFLMDADRPYDNQALAALRRCRAAKKSQYDSAVQRLLASRTSQGISPNEDVLKETLDQMGYTALNEKVTLLDKAIERFASVVGTEERSIRSQLDPKRTVFTLDPPREFPSVAAMDFFLDSNPGEKAKHDAFRAQALNHSSLKTEPSPEIREFVEAADPDAG
jgi:hypothetical protein